MSDHSRWQDDLAAYLLGSLEPAEAEELERHLEGCEECRERQSWLGPAIQLLPESVERLQPDPGLRERVLAEVRADAGARAASRKPRERRLRGILLRPAIGLAAVALLAAGVGGYALRGGEETTTTPPVRGMGVTAKLERTGDSGTLLLTTTERLPTGEIYQAWVNNGDRIEPSSLFDAHADGTASAAIEGLEGADAVMVTIEPRGGSTEPTSAALVSVPLSD